jgi:long-chain fatty acid transport protein
MSKHRSREPFLVRVLVAIVVTALPCAPALAASFQLIEQSGSGLGNAYAGQAAGVRDASAVFFNPAALTRIPGRQAVLAVNPIGLSVTFADRGSTGPHVPGFDFPVNLTGGNGGDAGGWVPVPSGYFSWQVADTVWFGLGANVPFGLTTDWEESFVGRFHALKSEVKSVNINPSVAFTLGSRFSLGFGASYQKLQATLSQQVHYGGISFASAASAGGPAAAGAIATQLGAEGLAREGSVTIEGDNWAWGFNAGALLELSDAVRLGVAYRSKVKHDLEGEATFLDAPSFVTTGPVGPIGAALNQAFASGPVTTTMELPDTLSVAVAYEGGGFDLLADWTWTGWSSIQDLTVVREGGEELSSVPLAFEDGWRAGLGGNVALGESWKLRLGTAFDRTPVRDAFRTPRLPDEDRIWLATGIEWKVSEKGSIDLGYAHLFIKEASSALSNMGSETDLPKGDLVGAYSGRVDIVSLQYSLTF